MRWLHVPVSPHGLPERPGAAGLTDPSVLPFPSVADGFYLAVYPLLMAGLLLLVRVRNETRSRASLIDASGPPKMVS